MDAKTAVDTVFVGKQRTFNRRFLQMYGHYLIEPRACTPAAGWDCVSVTPLMVWMAPFIGDLNSTQCGTLRCRKREPSTPSVAR